MTDNIDTLLFDQLAFIRSMTVKTVRSIDASLYNQIPTGYRNHIHWQVAHVWFVLERFAFHLTSHAYPTHDADLKLLGNGSSPANWEEEGATEMPEMDVWLERMASQPERIREALQGKLDEPLIQPLTTATGLTMNSARGLITYAIFHEGMHLTQIKMFAKQLQ